LSIRPGPGDTVLICAGYGPHVFAWGVQFALAAPYPEPSEVDEDVYA